MTDIPLLYNGPTSPFGRKCKVSALVLDVAHKEEKINKEFEIQNTDRAVGTRISYHLYKKFGNNNLDENSIELNFKGSAGQSFGAFAIKGLKTNFKRGCK